MEEDKIRELYHKYNLKFGIGFISFNELIKEVENGES